MKIESCATPKATMLVADVLYGTIFRYGNLTCGPYLRVTTGVVNLGLDEYYAAASLPSLTNYVALPNARLVLE